MRKLKIMEHISLDGVIQHSADDDGFPYSDWTAPYRTPRVETQYSPCTALVSTCCLAAELTISGRVSGPSSPLADGIHTATKYIATHRSESLTWGPFQSLGRDIVADIRRVKSLDGPDLISRVALR